MSTDVYIEAGLPNDEEVELLADYIGGYMIATEVETFETRMEQDEAFFFRMAPMLDAWYLGKRPRLTIVTRAADRHDADERILPIAPLRGARTMGVAGLLTAAAAVFAVVQFASREPVQVAPGLAQLPPSHASGRSGQAQVVAPVHSIGANRAATPPKETQLALSPMSVDSATELAIDGWMAVPLAKTHYTPSRLPGVARRDQATAVATIDSVILPPQLRFPELPKRKSLPASQTTKKGGRWHLPIHVPIHLPPLHLPPVHLPWPHPHFTYHKP